VTRIRRHAIIWAAWTLINGAAALLGYLRSSAFDGAPPPGWIWPNVAAIPIWSLLTPAILAVSRRFPLDRRPGPKIWLAHVAAIAGTLLIDGVSSYALHFILPGRELTLTQHLVRYAFVCIVFYAGIVAVEHAGRYHRLYVDQRVRESELEARLARAQLDALQLQIRPHFLFNVLNTIAGLVRVGNSASAVTMLARLGELIRLVGKSDGAQEVPVRKELELVDRYLLIEQARFGDRLAIEIKVDPTVEDALVPHWILQPLVENAVRHGIGVEAAQGRVGIVVEAVGPSLRLEVTDSGQSNGTGPIQGAGIGLANTRARLAQLYGAEQSFALVKTALGMSAVIHIPLHREARS
jgi:hypothetical protein